jgi:hypothetical protein
MGSKESAQAQQDAARELSVRPPADRQTRSVEAVLRRHLGAALYAARRRLGERRETPSR